MTRPLLELHQRHPRTYRENKFVYPVLSRRSQGLSIGINLNPDKVCNFDCIYCQVDRRSEAETRFVETERLLEELNQMLGSVSSGDIYQVPRFADVPQEFRRLNDLAFSGDGEPTTYQNFDDIVAQVAELKRRRGLDHVKLVLITNASMFHRPAVQRALQTFDHNHGEIWAKLEAGTEAYYRQIERTKIPFQRILENIANAAKARPVVIQSLFMRINDEPPPESELQAYCQRLNDLVAAGGQVRLVQIYTVARPPAESFVTALTKKEVDAIASLVAAQTRLQVACFYGDA